MRISLLPAHFFLVYLVACGGPDLPPPAPPAPAETPPPRAELVLPPAGSEGIDVSHFSGSVDWPAVSDAGYRFAYVKATEGIDSPDPRFAEHWSSLEGTALLRGAYHLFVTEDDPEEQARFFVETVGDRPGDLLPVVDIEILGHGTETSTLAANLRRFLAIVAERYGVRPMIYTAPNFWNAHLDDTFGEHPLWVAEYGVDEPSLPAGWTRWDLWQWADSDQVPGVEKDADLSRVRGVD